MENEGGPRHPQADPPALGEYQGFPLYPMPSFVTLETVDPTRTAAFFTGVLDFDVMFRGPEVAGVATLIHVRRGKYQDVLVVPAQSPAPPSGSLIVTFSAADPDELDALADRVRAASPDSLVQGPADMPWNARQLTVRDPDGHAFRFTSQARESRPGAVDEVLRGEDREAG